MQRPCAFKCQQHVAQAADRHHVEPVGRFIEHDIAGVVNQRARQRHLDALSLREALGAPFDESFPCRGRRASSAVRDRRRVARRCRAASRNSGCFRAPSDCRTDPPHAAARRGARAPSRSRRGCRCRRSQALPLSGVSTPYSMRKVVDLPAPLASQDAGDLAVARHEGDVADGLDVAESLAQSSISLDHGAGPVKLTKNGAGRCRSRQPHRASRGVCCVQKLRHQLRYTAGRHLAVSLAAQYQVPMARESLRARVRHPRAASPDPPRPTAAGWGRRSARGCAGRHPPAARPQLANLRKRVQLIRALVGLRDRCRSMARPRRTARLHCR